MPETSGPRVTGTDEERQFDDLMWRDMFGSEAGVVGDLDGTSYKLTLPSGSDIAAVGSTSQASVCVIGGFRHRINAGETQGVTIPPAVGAARTDIIAARLDLATFTGAPGPIKLVRIAGTSAGLPAYDSAPPGVEDLPLWSITRQPGQTLAQATVVRLFPRLVPSLDVPNAAPLPLSSPLGSIAWHNGLMYRRVLDASQVPAWETSSTSLSIRGEFRRASDSRLVLNSKNEATELDARVAVSSKGTGWTAWDPVGAGKGYSHSRPGRYLIQFHLQTSLPTNRWESMRLVVPNVPSIPIGDSHPVRDFGGVSGSYMLEAPNGVAFAFRTLCNAYTSTVELGIRAGSWWSCTWIGPF